MAEPESSSTSTKASTLATDNDQSKNRHLKRRNLGRQARHRRKKALEIEAASSAAATSEAKALVVMPSILPTDRDYVWPAVESLSRLSNDDKHALVAQLGYFPGNVLSVAARACDVMSSELVDGTEPLVVKLYPLVLRDETSSTKSRRKRKRQETQLMGKQSEAGKKNRLIEPFPTIYWVTHPRARALISKLELDTWGVTLEKRLKEDADAMESMRLAHAQYGKERYAMITEQDRTWIEKRRWEGAFAVTRGVAGIRNPESIKCLHAHTAHFWSGCKHNVVGKWVAEEVSRLLHKSHA
jgi:hypothetical protein